MIHQKKKRMNENGEGKENEQIKSKTKHEILRNHTRTCHSSRPWELSGLDFLTATAIPRPTLEGKYVFSSTQPLKTLPKPPSPRTVSGLKSLVAFFSSARVNSFTFGTPFGFDQGELVVVLLLLLPLLSSPLASLGTIWALQLPLPFSSRLPWLLLSRLTPFDDLPLLSSFPAFLRTTFLAVAAPLNALPLLLLSDPHVSVRLTFVFW